MSREEAYSLEIEALLKGVRMYAVEKAVLTKLRESCRSEKDALFYQLFVIQCPLVASGGTAIEDSARQQLRDISSKVKGKLDFGYGLIYIFLKKQGEYLSSYLTQKTQQ